MKIVVTTTQHRVPPLHGLHMVYKPARPQAITLQLASPSRVTAMDDKVENADDQNESFLTKKDVVSTVFLK